MQATHVEATTAPAPLWLLLAASFGLIVPNGLFLYWLAVEYRGIAAVLDDKLALAFIIDAFLSLILISIYLARRPIGRVGWPVFVVLSIAGGLGFSLPFFYWLNARQARR